LIRRHREQAHSHNRIGYISKILVGCQAAFAGKPAPTIGMGASAKYWSAVRPPSLAGQLPQLKWVYQQNIGRLSGRLRRQASSHNRIGYISKILVGCQAAFAGKPAPTIGMDASAKYWSAVRPPSQASQLPQLKWVYQQNIGRLSGRHRWQARSYKGSEYTLRSSPLIRPSVSSPAALDLDLPAPSGGRVEAFIWGVGA
jgi:hypothetical protein